MKHYQIEIEKAVKMAKAKEWKFVIYHAGIAQGHAFYETKDGEELVSVLHTIDNLMIEAMMNLKNVE